MRTTTRAVTVMASLALVGLLASPAMGTTGHPVVAHAIAGGGSPWGIAAGPNGSVYVADSGARRVFRVTAAGVSTPLTGTLTYGAKGITVGPDGTVWVAGRSGSGTAGSITRISRTGAVHSFALPAAYSGTLGEVVVGPDHNIWFALENKRAVARMTPSGHLSLFSTPTAGSSPYGMVVGPDHAIWFTEYSTARIGRITTAGHITEFPTPSAASYPWGIALGADGNLWFTESGTAKIGRITPAGHITEFPHHSLSGTPGLEDIESGPDGALWFTGYDGDRIGRITTAGLVTQYTVPSGTGPADLAFTTDGYLWLTGYNNATADRFDTGWHATARVAGHAVLGRTVTCSTGARWPGAITRTTYAWLRNGHVISGAASSHYTARSADVGKYLTCRRITHVRALTPTLVATSAGVRVTR